eukprot:tig00001416_g8958.t1
MQVQPQQPAVDLGWRPTGMPSAVLQDWRGEGPRGARSAPCVRAPEHEQEAAVPLFFIDRHGASPPVPGKRQRTAEARQRDGGGCSELEASSSGSASSGEEAEAPGEAPDADADGGPRRPAGARQRRAARRRSGGSGGGGRRRSGPPRRRAPSRRRAPRPPGLPSGVLTSAAALPGVPLAAWLASGPLRPEAAPSGLGGLAFEWRRRRRGGGAGGFVGRLRGAVAGELPGASTDLFGSFLTGLMVASSDLDAVVLHRAEREAPRGLLSRVRGALLAAGFRSVQAIPYARVPILKVEEGAVCCDVSFNSDSGLRSTRLLSRLVERYPPLVPLTRLLKRWRAARELPTAAQNGLSSYAWALMTAVYVMNVYGAEAGPALPARGALELLAGFFDFYAAMPPGLSLVSLRRAALLPLPCGADPGRKWVTVESPEGPGEDVARALLQPQGALLAAEVRRASALCGEAASEPRRLHALFAPPAPVPPPRPAPPRPLAPAEGRAGEREAQRRGGGPDVIPLPALLAHAECAPPAPRPPRAPTRRGGAQGGGPAAAADAAAGDRQRGRLLRRLGGPLPASISACTAPRAPPERAPGPAPLPVVASASGGGRRARRRAAAELQAALARKEAKYFAECTIEVGGWYLAFPPGSPSTRGELSLADPAALVARVTRILNGDRECDRIHRRFDDGYAVHAELHGRAPAERLAPLAALPPAAWAAEALLAPLATRPGPAAASAPRFFRRRLAVERLQEGLFAASSSFEREGDPGPRPGPELEPPGTHPRSYS